MIKTKQTPYDLVVQPLPGQVFIPIPGTGWYASLEMGERETNSSTLGTQKH